MKTIGLTGGIGSGKSTVAGYLEELGAVTVDLDKAGHEVLRQDDVRVRLVNTFGEEILDTGGNIDRQSLGNIVFSNPEALAKLNDIVHPVIDAIVDEKTAKCQQQGVKVLVLEAAAMLEAKRDWQVDELWVTVASEDAVINRIKERSGISEDAIKARITSQMSNEERIKLADVVVDNDGTLEELGDKVAIEWERLQERL